jgi:hypothetical protein
VNHQGSRTGYTALMYACINADERSVRLLVEKGALVSGIYNIHGCSAFHYAVSKKTTESEDIVRILLENVKTIDDRIDLLRKCDENGWYVMNIDGDESSYIE